MGKQRNRFYVVWQGRETGVFNSWNDCKKQVEGFTDAKYMGFASREEAEKAARGNMWDYVGKAKPKVVSQKLTALYGTPLTNALCVDAACSGNPGVLEYRGVLMPARVEVFHRGPYPEGTTNIGEFLAIVTGLAWLQKQNAQLPLYSDSRNGISWVKQKRVNTKLERTEKNDELFQIIDKALDWLHNNSYENRILKWETEVWGEIPADFGRK